MDYVYDYYVIYVLILKLTRIDSHFRDLDTPFTNTESDIVL